MSYDDWKTTNPDDDQLGPSPSEQVDALLDEKDDEIYRLKSIIRRILKHIENGTLVRDISKDAEVGWVLPMMRLVVDLKDATEAVKPAPDISSGSRPD
jgi:hypothetical protein